jgi:chemotaxis signal transduction protein
MSLDLILDDIVPPAAPAAAPVELERAQAIDCNGLAIAVPYRHARSVIDDDSLVPAPNALPWLAGAANIEGHIVAVIDLHAWVDPSRPRPPGRSRLLLCGDGEERLALRFEGLPQMVQVVPAASSAPTATAAAPNTQPDTLPQALRPYQRGVARSAGGTREPRLWPLVDIAALARTWALQLAT